MKTRKFTALLLVLCLLLTATPYSAPVRAVEEEHLAQEQTQEQTQVEAQEQAETQTAVEEAALAPLAEGIFFQFVDQAVFQANGHVARVPEEETLSTYVFRNSDGTKTVYYLPDNVKYVAEDGTMVDKDLTLVSQAGGYGVKRSDIQYLLPTSAASGIRMTHGNKQVTMYPQAPLGRATAATVSGDSVRYDNYFGSGIHLVYTPIPSGLKEDIVLDSYTGVNSFTFTLQTNGMRLYNSEGQYYFASSADAEEKMYLGDIVVYDAKGEPSAGTLTVTTVTVGQQYTLTVSADPAFLTDPDTVYPVTIDPTLESRAESNTDFIEDVSLYQNAPNANTGNWTYNHCGYYASANTTYGVCRTAVRLAGLKNDSVWKSLGPAAIVSAKFYIKEATSTAGVRLTLHNITNTTWTESNATWNTLADAYDATVSAEATLAYGGVAEFDFTRLAQDWKNSLVPADCSFMISSTDNTVDKAFYSAEFGTTAYRPYVVITYQYGSGGGDDFDTAMRIHTEAHPGITTTIRNEKRYFKFIPEVTGEYLFYNTPGTGNPYIWIYDQNRTLIASDNHTGGFGNFKLSITLTKDTTYYIALGHSGVSTGTYTMYLLMSAIIDNDILHIRNVGTTQYVDIHGPEEQILVHQWTYHKWAQGRWKLVRQNDGYYTIQSEYGNKYYIGVSNSNVGENNIQLYSGISDSVRWKIYAKSSGEIFIEPKSAPGKVLYVPNDNLGTELQLAFISDSVANRNQWKIEFKSNTTLEGQKWEKWCWAASARMLTNHYFDVPDARTQNNAVLNIFNSVLNTGGTPQNAIQAANYYYSGLINSNELNLVCYDNSIYSEGNLKKFLNEGHVIYIGRAEYNNGSRVGGHASVIVGYTTIYKNGGILYQFWIYDPWPVTQPDPWTSPVTTIGQAYKASYQWICNGKNKRQDDIYLLPNMKIWDRCIVVETSYSASVLTPVFD